MAWARGTSERRTPTLAWLHRARRGVGLAKLAVGVRHTPDRTPRQSLALALLQLPCQTPVVLVSSCTARLRRRTLPLYVPALVLPSRRCPPLSSCGRLRVANGRIHRACHRITLVS